MNKMKFETPNLTAENVAKIAELFPGVVTEGKVKRLVWKPSKLCLQILIAKRTNMSRLQLMTLCKNALLIKKAMKL